MDATLINEIQHGNVENVRAELQRIPASSSLILPLWFGSRRRDVAVTNLLLEKLGKTTTVTPEKVLELASSTGPVRFASMFNSLR